METKKYYARMALMRITGNVTQDEERELKALPRGIRGSAFVSLCEQRWDWTNWIAWKIFGRIILRKYEFYQKLIRMC